jgi:pyroglutamyl-peptidase
MGSNETEASLEILQYFQRSNTRTAVSPASEIKVLVTGFGPFRDHLVNASWESVKLINPDKITIPANLPPTTQLNVSFFELEVVYNTIHKQVPVLWDCQKPHLTVHVGVSGIAKAITLEQCAHNCGYCSPDIRDCLPEQNICLRGGRELIHSGFNMTEVVAAVNDSTSHKGIRAEVSYDPGRFLCDFTYYQSLAIDKDRTAFIHVPPLGKPYSADEMAAAISTCLSEFLRQLQDKQLL